MVTKGTKKLAKTTAACPIRLNRIFVLDTNVLIHDPNALHSFQGVVIGIPFVVLEELDTFKKEPGEKGRNAREAIRMLDELREKGSLQEGVKLDDKKDGSILKVFQTPSEISFSTSELHAVKDNLIIQTCKELAEQNCQVTLVTKDLNCRVKADVLGLDAEDYMKGNVSLDTFYKGWIKVPMPAIDLKKASIKNIKAMIDNKDLMLNEYVIMHSENNEENSRLFRFLGGEQFKEISDINIMGFTARNIQQLMVLDLLTDDSIQLVTMLGQAGTGKTFLTLVAGLYKVMYEKMYKKLLVTRPIVALGADIGYLPGDIQEKLHFWMQPVHDNLEFISSQLSQSKNEKFALLETPAHQAGHHKQHNRGKQDQYEHRKRRDQNGKYDRNHRQNTRQHHDRDEDHDRSERYHRDPRHLGRDTLLVDRLQKQGIISLEAITYMRGRSIPNQFMFIDEVQNLTPHEVKTLVSRAGEGTKVILAGDPYQIDSPYLDFTSNGLTVTTDKMKNYSIFGTAFLETSERSALAKLTSEVL